MRKRWLAVICFGLIGLYGCGNDASQDEGGEAGVNCGNGVLDKGEKCDDGNKESHDGCSRLCVIEKGYLCVTPGEPCTKKSDGQDPDDPYPPGPGPVEPEGPVCGNGELEEGEVCDDRNTESGDGCSADCQTIEEGFKCETVGYDCVPNSCGDGVVDANEICDLGELNVAYGFDENDCSVSCKPAHYCGDGLLDQIDKDNGEECDNAGVDSSDQYDGCSSVCKRSRFCGDGQITDEEECDDGNEVSNDGCSAECKRETGFSCKVENGMSICTSQNCGNGVIDTNETCDDGNHVAGDGCSSICQIEKGWSCTVDAEGALNCVKTCGNGVIDAVAKEVCDDGNDVSGDGCSETCQVESGYDCDKDKTTGKSFCYARACGDGLVAGTEQCDDGNTVSGDGCSKSCKREAGWHCDMPGKPCAKDSCGDGVITGDETCDEGSAPASGGCVNCKIQAGWKCPNGGESCTTAACGDGVLEGAETCEESNECCVSCQIQKACKCDSNGKNCVKGSCGNGTVEVGEQCDDGNSVAGDGCSPVCEKESIFDCNDFGCKPVCGDGLVIPDVEECDDGNLVSGDGCSSQCKIESGYSCTVKTQTAADSLDLPIVYRDFIRYLDHSAPSGTDGYVSQALYDSLPADCKPGGAGASYRYLDPVYHLNLEVGRPSPDFLSYCPDSHCERVVKEELGSDGKPDLAPVSQIYCPDPIEHQGTDCRYLYTCPAVFKWWYTDVPGINKTIKKTLHMTKVPSTTDTYEYSSASFWPIDNEGYGNAGSDGTGNGEFTSEFQTYFKYKGGEHLIFDGDDDVWVFFNGHLGVDVGGIHPQWKKEITLDTATAASKFHMYPGGIYPLNMFHAERCRGGSSYRLTISGFVSMGKSTCDSVCGDGIIRGDEECDYVTSDLNNVEEQHANGCNHCKLAPFCGNGKVESGEGCDTSESWCVNCKIDTCGNGTFEPEHEQCDKSAPASDTNKHEHCLDTCKLSGCGDGFVDAANGEECDDGNTSNDDMCTTKCTVPICGDGIVSSSLGEVCDDGKNDGSYGGCGLGCTYASPKCGDGVIDKYSGEECDDGDSNGDGYGQCGTNCKYNARCGDGILQPEYEYCDDGEANGTTLSSCPASCMQEIN